MKYLIDITPPEALNRLKPRTIEQLKTTKIPNHAFVVYEVPKLLYQDGETVETTGIVPINVEDQPSQEYNLNDLLNRGGKYCCHFNFPEHNDKNVERQNKYKLYNDPNAGNPWDRLRVHCLRQIGHASEISAENRKYKEALAEIERLQAELAKKSKGDKKNEQQSRKSGKGTQEGTEPSDPEKADGVSEPS